MRANQLSSKLAALLSVAVISCSASALAQGDGLAGGGEQSVDRAAMMNLARDFVTRIDAGFQRADEYWFSLTGNSAEKESFLDYYEDGEILLLQIKLPDNIILQDTVMAEKSGDSLFVSLSDLVTAARFPIVVRAEDGVAEGWFIRENQTFVLDYNNLIAQSAGRNYAVNPDDVKIVEGDIWVRGPVLAEWLGFDLEVNPNTQSMEVMPERKWPIQEKIARSKRQNTGTNRRKPPEKPRQEDPYDIADVPNMDVFLSHRLSRRNLGTQTRTETRSNYTLRTSGDLAGHTGQSIVSGNNEDKLSSIRLKMGKESDKDDLLGPLKARSYEFGDITTTNIPLVGGSRSEFGARVTNRDPFSTQNALTPISGFSIPGWDVELYRDQQYVAVTTVGEDGQYRFDDVVLFAGENRFRVVQYGLQGEIEEDEITMFVNPSLRNAGGVYDVSLSLNNKQTYLKNETDDPDRNSPHLSAQYELQATDKVAVRTGIKVRDEDEEQKIYAHAGTVANLSGTILNTDVAVDNDGAYAASAVGRRNFGKHNVAAAARYTSEDYNIDSSADKDAEYKLDVSARGDFLPLAGLGIERARYNVAAEYNDRGDDDTAYSTRAGLSARYGKLNYNTSLDYIVRDNAGQEDKSLVGRTGVRGNFLGANWRTTAIYDFLPSYEAREYEVSVQKNINDALRGEVRVDYQPKQDLTEGEVSLSWQGDHITVTPTVSYDSEQNLEAFINARFGLAYNPVTHDVEMHGQQLTNRGGVAARVYLDKNGDRLFDEGDELLPDVQIESVHSGRSALSDEDGVAFIPDIPTNRITDIILREDTLPDPFWIAGFEGASIQPRAGNTTILDFPVHIAGEIDGTIYAVNDLGTKVPVKNVRAHLYSADGELQDTAFSAYDGFYLFSRVPPGDYLLIINAEDARNNRFDPPAPQEIRIGYEGTILYANDIVGQSGALGVGFDVVGAEDFGQDLAKIDPAMLQGQKIILNLGEYNSQLLMALTWYHMRNRYQGILGDAKLIVPPSESMASMDDNKHTMRVKTNIMNLEDARFICRSLLARGFTCGVELLPDDFFAEISVSAMNTPEKS